MNLSNSAKDRSSSDPVQGTRAQSLMHACCSPVGRTVLYVLLRDRLIVVPKPMPCWMFTEIQNCEDMREILGGLASQIPRAAAAIGRDILVL